jgi:hypothetical protein
VQPEQTDTLSPLTGNWVQQLFKANLNINDPRIDYPAFPRFCVDVYNWLDTTFNSYDKNYVVSTPWNWQLNVDGTAWNQSYDYVFGMSNDDLIAMRTRMNYDVGIHLSFIGVGIGYTWNVNDLGNIHPTERSTFDFSFRCALFSAELRHQKTSGNTAIVRFADYEAGNRIYVPLDDVKTDMFYARAFYYFNNKRFSDRAVYSFSKYQKCNQGSWLIGAGYQQQKIEMDFSGLPNEVLLRKPEALPLLSRIKYYDFNVVGGYSYNVVMPHNWVFNVTALPGLGYKRTISPNNDSALGMISANFTGRMGLTYNYENFFANLTCKYDGGFAFDKDYSFWTSTQRATFVFGFRF